MMGEISDAPSVSPRVIEVPTSKECARPLLPLVPGPRVRAPGVEPVKAGTDEKDRAEAHVDQGSPEQEREGQLHAPTATTKYQSLPPSQPRRSRSRLFVILRNIKQSEISSFTRPYKF